MNFEISYGEETRSARLDGVQPLGTLDIADVPPLPDPAAALRDGLRDPIGMDCDALGAYRAGDTVTIVVSDSFRYTAVELLLPTLLDALSERGIREEDIHFLFSTGTHRGPTDDEAARILGDAVYARFKDRAIAHDPYDKDQLVDLGTTDAGTPIAIHRRAVETDHLILTGTVVMHYFGGFGGGRKSLVPGVAAVETIAHNHALNLDRHENRLNPAVRIGTLDGNPVAEDMFAASSPCKVDFIVNTVLDRNGAIAGLFTGDFDAAHRSACAFAHALYAAPIGAQADLVIATAGKAKNFIQSHKALYNAYQALKPGGRMVFLAPAPEGYGGNKFAQWLALGSCDAVIAELRKNAEINGQTALSTLEKAPSAIFVTEMDAAQVAALGAQRADSLDAALAQAVSELRAAGVEQPTVWLMPSAPYTVPVPAAEHA